jgi:hypothetical protein
MRATGPGAPPPCPPPTPTSPSGIGHNRAIIRMTRRGDDDRDLGDLGGLLALVSLALVGLTVFFWPVLVSRFELLPGVLGDTRFNTAILEHWWQLLRRGGDWRTVPMFHPATGTLGYGDGLVLFVPVYWAARAASLTPDHALVAVVAVLLLVGYLSAAWLYHRLLALPPWIAVLAAFLQAFAAVRLVHYGQVQLFAAMFVPALLGLALLWARQLGEGRRGVGPALVLALGVTALLATTFCVGWFTLLLLGLTGLALAVQASPGAPVARALPSLALFALTVLVALGPLLGLYLPRYAEVGSRPWVAVAPTLPAPADFVNVGPTNWVWSRAMHGPAPAGRSMEWELSYGLAPALLLLFLITAATLLAFRRRDWLGGVNALPGARYARALAAAVLAGWLLMVALGDASLWRVVHAWIPGAAVIRGVFRFQTVLLLGVLGVAATGLAGLWQAATSTPRRALVGLLAAFLVVEQADTGLPVFDARREAGRPAAWPAPPAGCVHFLLLADPASDRSWDQVQIDAMLLALRVGRPTLNGYSGDAPRGWELRDPRAPDYLAHAAHWAAAHGVTAGLCTFDTAGGIWRGVRPRAPDLEGVNLVTHLPRSLDEGLGVIFSGFHGAESEGRWTDGRGRIAITPPAPAGALRIDGVRGGPTRGPVRVRVNGRPRFEQALPPGPFAIRLALDAPVETVEIESDTFVPRAWGLGEDGRRLGVMVSGVLLQRRPLAATPGG